jgi:hypothetical protein
MFGLLSILGASRRFRASGGRPTLQAVAADADDQDADRAAKSARNASRGRLRRGMGVLSCVVMLAGASPSTAEDLHPERTAGRAGDLWQVAGLEQGSKLNLRARPSTEGRILARLDEHAVVRKLGCIDVGVTTWCKVETRAGIAASGWLDARYLAEASLTGSTPNARAVAGTYDAVGSIGCMFEGNDLLKSCLFGVVRTGYRKAAVDVTFPGGFKLKLTFDRERVTASLGKATAHREGRMTVVTVSGTEHFVIPDSVIDGDLARGPR